jgi:hypothetical protein
MKAKEIEKTGYKKAKNSSYIWANEYYLESINPKYGFFCSSTLHTPTEVWSNSKLAGIEDKMSKIMLHRTYNVENPKLYWDWSIKEGESRTVYFGVIRDVEHLEQLIIDLGIKEI